MTIGSSISARLYLLALHVSESPPSTQKGCEDKPTRALNYELFNDLPLIVLLILTAMNSSAHENALPLSCDLFCDTFSDPMLYVNVRGKYILFYSIPFPVYANVCYSFLQLWHGHGCGWHRDGLV